jgi:hypothetical protein
VQALIRANRMVRGGSSDTVDGVAESMRRLSRSFVTTMATPVSYAASDKQPFTGYGSQDNNVLQLFSFTDVIAWINL